MFECEAELEGVPQVSWYERELSGERAGQWAVGNASQALGDLCYGPLWRAPGPGFGTRCVSDVSAEHWVPAEPHSHQPNNNIPHWSFLLLESLLSMFRTWAAGHAHVRRKTGDPSLKEEAPPHPGPAPSLRHQHQQQTGTVALSEFTVCPSKMMKS